jgi:endonuclease/exonuclease/phosphatase family metal-dependent hydrolase
VFRLRLSTGSFALVVLALLTPAQQLPAGAVSGDADAPSAEPSTEPSPEPSTEPSTEPDTDAAPGTGPLTAKRRSVVRVGSFNIKNVIFERKPRRTWPKRRDLIARQVVRHRIGVLGIQEANNGPGGIWRHGWNQYLDLRRALNKAGKTPYRLTARASHNCRNPWSGARCRYRDRGASKATRILFDASRYRQIRAGAIKYRKTAGNRYLVWTVLEVRRTGKRFLFTTTHITSGSKKAKARQWRQMIGHLHRLKGKRNLPIIATGDMNASKYNPITKKLLPKMRKNGFGDVLNQRYRVARIDDARPRRVKNAWISSLNRGRLKVSRFGHEDNRRLGAANLDYIFASNRLPVYRWKTVVSFNRKTLRMKRPIPSDHNLVWASVGLPRR